MFVIKNDSGEYWSNEHGWTGFNEAEFFTDWEQQDGAFNLPVGGEWVELAEDNLIQFARLLDEIRANCELPEMDALCESMDCEPEFIESIFNRATETFERSKQKVFKKNG
jgi:hypothetical protein